MKGFKTTLEIAALVGTAVIIYDLASTSTPSGGSGQTDTTISEQLTTDVKQAAGISILAVLVRFAVFLI